MKNHESLAGAGNMCITSRGALKYLEDVPQEDSQWKGDCFVFDGSLLVMDWRKGRIVVLCLPSPYPARGRARAK